VADDPNTVGEIEYKQVLDTFVLHTDKLVDLYIDGEVISTTGEHPFWTPDKGWVEAKDLVVGSLVQTSDGRIIDVDGVETREGDFTVYNFKVEGFHSYFVSDLGILVHNANCTFPDKSLRHGLAGEHGPAFGVFPGKNKKGDLIINNPILNEFSEALSDFIDSAPMAIPGIYRGQPVTHYYDYNTQLWAAVNSSNNKFVAGFRLGDKQAFDLLTTGTFW
jgi:hypothetical protein